MIAHNRIHEPVLARCDDNILLDIACLCGGNVSHRRGLAASRKTVLSCLLPSLEIESAEIVVERRPKYRLATTIRLS